MKDMDEIFQTSKNKLSKIEDIEKIIANENTVSNKKLFTILLEAIKSKTTDIHIEGLSEQVRIRYRIDGLLKEVLKVEKDFLAPIVSKVKILSGLDIVEKRRPQDGRFSLLYKNREIDFRTSIIPTIYGEKVVLRILDKFNYSITIDDLYLTEKNKEIFLRNINKNNGVILVNGPTGSGKSTTLYSILKYKNKEEFNISTVEDPIEYQIDGINQTQCKEDINLDFSTMLRALLRQDPDILMIGEIRDKETAEIAIKASLTGHLVFSTVHSNNSLGCINRLENLGVDSYLLNLVLEMIISQRLVRKLCPYCKTKDEKYLEKIKSLSLDIKEYNNIIFYKAKGCEKCMNTGYIGRVPIFEVIEFEDKKNIRLYLEDEKNSLLYDGVKKAIEGLTSLDELLRQI